MTTEAAAGVGRSIRRARTRAGLSMREVAARAGVSQPFLSDIENGRSTPSVATLYRLADALDVSAHELVPPLPGDDIVVVRADSGPTNPVDETPGVVVSRLVAGGPGRALQARRYSVSPGQPVGDWFEHDGEDLLYVVAGVVWLEFGSGRTERLAAGDTVWHASHIPHRWRADDVDAAELMLVTYEPVRRPADDHR